MESPEREHWFSQDEISRAFSDHPMVEIRVLAMASAKLASFTSGEPTDCIRELRILNEALVKAYNILDPKSELRSPREYGTRKNNPYLQPSSGQRVGPQVIKAAERRSRSASYTDVPILPELKHQTQLFLQDMERRLSVLTALAVQAHDYAELSTKYRAAYEGMERIAQRNGEASRSEVDRMNADYFHDQSIYYREASLSLMQVVRNTAQLVTLTSPHDNFELSDVESEIVGILKNTNEELLEVMRQLNSISQQDTKIKYGEMMDRMDDLKTLQQSDAESHQYRVKDREDRLPKVVRSLVQKIKPQQPEISNETKMAMQDIEGHKARLSELELQALRVESQLTHSRHEQYAKVIKACAVGDLPKPELSILRVGLALAHDNVQKIEAEAKKLDRYNTSVERTINEVERYQVGDSMMIREKQIIKREEVSVADQIEMLNKFLARVDSALTDPSLPEAFNETTTHGRREKLGLTDTMHAVRQRSHSVAEENGPPRLDLQNKRGENAATEAQRARAKSISGYNNSLSKADQEAKSQSTEQQTLQSDEVIQNDNNTHKFG